MCISCEERRCNEVIGLFSSREIAMAIWVGIFFILIIILAIKSKDIRHSIYDVLRSAANKYIVIFFIITIAYVATWIKNIIQSINMELELFKGYNLLGVIRGDTTML